ncbi:diguanylate cyclase (GGDEF)-like protein [Micromonospora pisi]|uniref:Diguanylate cyclase (GGDEF)-like protein n=1 Tax=Micromonospora pisi TaxID=589240 RepID=A0A495JH14_9ACTN|nr:GGDEF domain-containing protein [Micromonospora pisi]RKR88286.1 diguanylate cyclase (GGDEF)-like protein [Micromonospora pisi]
MSATTIAVIAAIATAEVLQAIAVGLKLRHLHARIAAIAETAGRDYLTGIAGRRGLHDTHRDLTIAGTPPGVLLLDLTLFKDVNDTFGHDTGDDLLSAVAARLHTVATTLRGLAGRLGGDEFVLLLPHATTSQQLMDAAAVVRQALAEPVTIDGAPDPLTVSCVIGLAPPTATPVPGKPFRTADIALYHARHHRQTHAIYQPGMTYPTAADRHGARLRDQRPAPPVAVFDTTRFQHLAAGDVSSDVAHPDDIAELNSLLEVLDPGSRDFGTDVHDLLSRCVAHGAMRYRDPITDVSVHPTTVGEARDGGFLLLVHLDNAVTVASDQIHPRMFHQRPHAADLVLTDIAETVCRVYDTYRAHTTTPQRPR